MASLYKKNNGWVLSVHIADHRCDRKKFATEEEARAYAAAEGITFGQRRKRATRDEVVDKLAAAFVIDDDSGCWIWQKPLDGEGYGRSTWRDADERVVSGAHRIVMDVAVERVPTDLVIDHLCRNRACINPDHLEVVKQRTNVLRSPIAIGAINAAKTHCAQGHPYDEANTYVYVSKSPRACTMRICRACRREYQRRYAAARKAAA